MAVIIPVLARATVYGIALGAGATLLVPFESSHAKKPLFLLVTISTVAARAIAWYAGVPAAMGAILGAIFLGIVAKRNDTSAESIALGAFAGGVIGYLFEQAFRGITAV